MEPRKEQAEEQVVPFSETVKKSKGGLNKQLFVVEAVLAAGMDAMAPLLDKHFAYLHGLEKEGTLFAAGPLGRVDEMTWSGGGLVVLATATLEEAEPSPERIRCTPPACAGSRSGPGSSTRARSPLEARTLDPPAPVGTGGFASVRRCSGSRSPAAGRAPVCPNRLTLAVVEQVGQGRWQSRGRQKATGSNHQDSSGNNVRHDGPRRPSRSLR